ncbi:MULTISPECIES: transglycosylase SLT domain-containing protein [unclassified Arcicella]|uniref:transglycosylase SLT domain-containing protein n=1 Tax=unclassified Arcicella TaxID=2644986 RepID=UPI00285E78C2|nr:MULTISPECIES: transglycosylase SLT domain-containing protein [unclassified Arcicella]MDR6564955.1 hypothetical protein [Arcicella sp. BE51]MDR6814745.1 hypothetical protein [Arcicella sp. BE140]MDR6826191.1 hypothetical protein [Arcicella sp. BE139]
MALLYINKVPSSLRTAFQNEVIKICSDLGIANPDWLMLVFYAESRINPQAQNGGSTATGLIQFLESTANDLGTTTAKLYKMNHVQQLPYVREYLRRLIIEKGKPESAYDLYFLVHSKKGFGKADDYVMYVKGSLAYKYNPLDYNSDGTVTVGEIKTFLNKALPITYNKANLYKSTSSSSTFNTILIIGLVAVFGTATYFLAFKNGFQFIKAMIFKKK